MAKQRLDLAMVNEGLAESREKAKALIMAGQVKVDGKIIDKPGTNISEGLRIELIGPILPFVSRGGLKLAKAITTFDIDLNNKVIADIGASTGGFTDCALQNGARKVYAIDVGYGQLDWKLRNDPRVVNMERTNARYLKASDLAEQVDFISIDVAFISLEKILPVTLEILKDNGEIIALIKPQFEAGKEKIGKKGVVRDPKIHLEVITRILNYVQSLNFIVRGLTYSPIKGPEGNIEYLLWLSNNKQLESLYEGNLNLKMIVEQAHSALKG
ncbi:MAG: TlyA family RNA methyltransferase [Peptococcales bacterium]|jgi:23S rRNA (cytidine1920-2'-O)/16S rRNA (cytidine1409-2'-O)-methyltransferase